MNIKLQASLDLFHEPKNQTQLPKNVFKQREKTQDLCKHLPLQDNRQDTHSHINGGFSRPKKPTQKASVPSIFDTGQQRVFSDDEICGLCEEGHLDRILDVLSIMDREGVSPSHHAYWSILKLCNKENALYYTERTHSHIILHGFEFSISLAEYLVITLVKCGGLEAALRVFHKLSHRTIYSWTAIISGYSDSGKGSNALEVYKLMQEERVQPNEYTFVSLCKACGDMRDLEEGKRVHAEALKYRCASSLFVGTGLLDMYAKCGSIVDARTVFDQLPGCDVVAWTALLAAYVNQDNPEEALNLYRKMKEQGVNPNAWTLVCVLQACCCLAEKEEAVVMDGRLTKATSLKLGESVHNDVRREGFESNVSVCNALVSMYGKCLSLANAQMVFSALSHPDTGSLTAMMSAFIEQGHGEEVLELYTKIQGESNHPNKQTFLFAIQACCMIAEKEGAVLVEGQWTKRTSLKTGQGIHADSQKDALDMDPFVGSALISMYGRCGSILEAENVFSSLPQQDVVSWTAMLSAFVEQDQGERALCLYRQMKEKGTSPNGRTLVVALQACCSLAEGEEPVINEGKSIKMKSLKIGQELHRDAQIMSLELDIFVASTLISMYGKCGSIPRAERVFRRLPLQSVVSWTVMLLAYMENDQWQKALQLYEKMGKEGVPLDDAVLVGVLQACCKTGNVEICRQIHGDTIASGYDLGLLLAGTTSEYEPCLLLMNSLIHAYGNFGSMADAQALFDILPQPNVVSWTALIAGHAQGGNFAAVLETFEKMQVSDIQPNAVTFTTVLAACSRVGLVEKGVYYFECMSKHYMISPTSEHYGSMIDLLGRAGDMVSVKNLLSKMPEKPDLSTWLSLLSSCHNHGDVHLGKEAFDQAVSIEPS